MSADIKELHGRILAFLYWEGQVDPNYLTVDIIQEETDLTDAIIQDGLNFLREDGFVEFNIREKDVRIVEAKITMRGIDEAKSRLDI